MTLFIDTSSNTVITIALNNHGTRIEKTVTPDRKTQAVLPLIVDLLTSLDKTIQDVHAIQVHAGPGSFTGLRVGASIANTLGTLLKIPINGQEIGELVKPQYS